MISLYFIIEIHVYYAWLEDLENLELWTYPGPKGFG